MFALLCALTTGCTDDKPDNSESSKPQASSSAERPDPRLCPAVAALRSNEVADITDRDTIDGM
ncbi:MAG: hypothetical protein QOH79_3128 [Acidimicrobiaceae bacterium]